ncbi:MAG: type II toxin-antitoxin system VapC family toxin [Verrucomicrobia bacterium]|nr:type II toxin-antitoxin system VapC family toxin [Verrucomicrobiota bacterium]MCH8526738.1 type II toxin-antitoxin system VapC family toxin [Kiritimatiellia bacterium]
MTYLLDTSVYSQPLRRKPVISALKHWAKAGDSNCKISVVTLAEIEFGLELERSTARQTQYESLLQNRLEIVPCGMQIWQRFARVKARQQKIGRVVADLDLLIASTAMVFDWTVATLNHHDFSKIENLKWEDWCL